MHNATPNGEQGFTLIELMVVITILGILAGLVTFGIGTAYDDAEHAKNTHNEAACKRAVGYSRASANPNDTFRDWLSDDSIDCDF